jgi:hypothetical protein
MGGFYGSTQSRTTDIAAAKAAAELVAQQRSTKCLIGPEINGWIGVYPEDRGQDHSFGHAVAQLLPCDVLHLMVHDDDVLAYWLWRNGHLVDRYWSNPGALDEENRQEEEDHRGDPEKFRPLIGDNANRLAAILKRDEPYTFESERLTRLAKVLGISNAVTAFEYLEGGERKGIKGWRKFAPIPPRFKEPKVKRPTAKSNRSKMLRAGVLLYAEESQEFFVVGIGCVCEDGFILGWSDVQNGEHRIGVLGSPWKEARASAVEFPSHLTELSTGGDRSLSLIRAAQSVRVVDGRNTLQELSNIKNLRGAVVSPQRDILAYAAAQNVAVVEVGTGRQVTAFSSRNPSELAIHPSGRWVVASDSCLHICDLAEGSSVRDFYVGGNARVAIANIVGIEEPGCSGFSQDGTWFWCGTNVGLRIYEWESLANRSSRRPRWQIRLRDQLPSFWAKQVTAIAEEPDGNGVVFGTFRGKLARFDLHTGELFKLADLPTGGSVETVLFSEDGSALAVYSTLEIQKGPRSMPKFVGSWEVLDYLKLRNAAVALGQAGRSNPVDPKP